MAKDERVIIGIDVGSSNVRVLGARYLTPGDLELFALGQAPSLGVRRGIVEDVDDASYAIRAALEDARLDGRLRSAEVLVGVGGKHVASESRSGEVPVARKDGMVTERDVVHAIEAARQVDLGPDRVLLHHIPCGFRIDGFRCRRNPVGMHGSMALAETHLVTASAAAAQGIRRAVQMAGQSVDYLVANGLAAAHAVLRPEEKALGVILLDIGGGTTDVAGFVEGSLYHASALPLGGNQITSDLAIALNTSFSVAERVLMEHGIGSPEGVDLSEEITVPCFGMAGYRHARIQYLYDVIRLRVAEILHLAVGQLRHAFPDTPAPAGLVLTGGVANLPGIERLAEQALRIPARVGRPPEQDYAPQTLRDPAFAAILGALQLDADPLYAPVRERRPAPSSPFRLIPQLNLLRS